MWPTTKCTGTRNLTKAELVAMDNVTEKQMKETATWSEILPPAVRSTSAAYKTRVKMETEENDPGARPSTSSPAASSDDAPDEDSDLAELSMRNQLREARQRLQHHYGDQEMEAGIPIEPPDPDWTALTSGMAGSRVQQFAMTPRANLPDIYAQYEPGIFQHMEANNLQLAAQCMEAIEQGNQLLLNSLVSLYRLTALTTIGPPPID
jgi:hypothetical protein